MELVDTNVVTGATFAGDTMKHKCQKCATDEPRFAIGGEGGRIILFGEGR